MAWPEQLGNNNVVLQAQQDAIYIVLPSANATSGANSDVTPLLSHGDRLGSLHLSVCSVLRVPL
jgi:hypothetical protein